MSFGKKTGKSLLKLVLLTALPTLLLSCGSKSEDGGEEEAPNNPLHGGKETGGGFLGSYLENPWFIQNTTNIDYCIEIDEANFGVDLATSKKKIAAAFAFWKLQFDTINSDSFIQGLAKLGTQTVNEVPCSSPHQLTVYLGTLPSNLLPLLGREPQYVIGKAVLTSYDKVNLKGEGFIYISPENGPLKINAALENRWTIAEGIVLDLVLAHELGHVFIGARHIENSLLAEDLPRRAISFDLLMEYWAAKPGFNLFFPPGLVGGTKLKFSGVYWGAKGNVDENPFGLLQPSFGIEFSQAAEQKRDSVHALNFYDGKTGENILSLEARHKEGTYGTKVYQGCLTRLYLNEQQAVLKLPEDDSERYDPLDGAACIYSSMESLITETLEVTLPSGSKIDLDLEYTPQTMKIHATEVGGTKTLKMLLNNATLIP